MTITRSKTRLPFFRLLFLLAIGTCAPAFSQTPIVNPLDLSGTWYNPATSGQGFVFDIAPDGKGNAVLFGGWFTYTPPDLFNEAYPLWFTLQGSFQTSQSQITVPIYFNGDDVANAVPLATPTQVGSASIRFSDCTHAELDYSFSDTTPIFPLFEVPAGGGSIPLVRLMADSGCNSIAVTATKSNRGFSGTWYNPATSGQGFVLEINPLTNDGFLFGGWFYRSAGWSSWFTLQGPFAANSTEADIPFYCAPGGLFDSSDLPTTGSTTMQCGTAHLTFTSCTSASLTYSIKIGGPATPPDTIPLQRLTAVPADCPLQ